MTSRMKAAGISDQEAQPESEASNQQQATMGGGKQKATLVTAFHKNKQGG